jgi:hypothetical protein
MSAASSDTSSRASSVASTETEAAENTQNHRTQVERYYIRARIPHLSQQANPTGSPKAALRILKSDSIQIILPKPDKFQDPWLDDDDYLQGVSQEAVSMLFDESGEFFRLDKEAKSGHWKPTKALLRVETSPGSWTPIVVLIIIKDFVQQRPLLAKWIDRIKSQIVSDWKLLKTRCPTVAVQQDFMIASTGINEGNSNETRNLRGKKWRRERRRLSGQAAKLPKDTNETRLTVSTGGDPETPQLGNNTRGRRWRRLRRAATQSSHGPRTLVDQDHG